MTALSRLDFSRLLQDRSLTRLAVLVIALVVGFSLASPNFLTLLNFQSMGFQVAEIGILSLAVLLSMLTGGIDLSIVSIASICAITTAKMFSVTGAAEATGSRGLLLMVLSCAVGLAAGTACGLLNGLLITRVGITPILATLGTLQLLNGIAIIWTGGAALYGFPDSFLNIGSFYVGRVPIPVIVLVVAALGTAVFVNRTGMGLRLRLVGANPTTATYSGLNNDRVLMSTYVGSALLASIAGIVISARSASANADYGASYVLLAIVIVVLGGVNPMGGYGTVFGVVLAALALQFVARGLNMLGMNQFLYNVAQGVILIGAMSLNAVLDRRRSARGPTRRNREHGNGPPSNEAELVAVAVASAATATAPAHDLANRQTQPPARPSEEP